MVDKNTNEIKLNTSDITSAIENEGSYKQENIFVKEWNSDTIQKDLNYVSQITLNNSTYTGILNKEFDRDIIGLNHFANGDKYLGQWSKDNMSNHGVYLYNPVKVKSKHILEIYMGMWENNNKAREGAYVWIEETPSNKNFDNCNFESFIGLIEKGNFSRGVYLSKHMSNFYIYYGGFKDGKKHDDVAYFYDNDGQKDRVFRGSIKNDIVEGGFFVEFHNDEVDVIEYIEFEDGLPQRRSTIEENTVKRMKEACLNFREILLEEDWFGIIYDKAKFAYNEINKVKGVEFFDKEDKYNDLLKVISVHKEIPVYPHLCSKMK